ncbi:MAG: serine--tRNA ligase [Candidatus Omnitrophota bacterium]
MLDIKLIREKKEWVEEQLRRRDAGISLDEIVEMDARRRALQAETDEKRSRQNIVSKEIPQRKKEKQNVDDLMLEMKSLSDEIKQKSAQLRELEDALYAKVSELPNIPHESVPTNPDKKFNVEVRSFGKKKELGFKPKNHLELGKIHNLLDFERGAKIAGSRFPLYIGWGAELEWALLNFMREHHRDRGYISIIPPFLLNRETTFASGNLPKFEDQLYKCKDDPFYLLPTSEVPMTSLYRDEILEEEVLPLYYTALSPCFRREAGAPGVEERGLVRVHQFNKVEMYKFTTPESSYDELEKLVKDAEHVLEELELHYRTMLLVTGDIGNQSAKTYDVEVWLPGQNSYYEVSSCSNCEDYQARRGNIRYRPKNDNKLRFVHTLNGSGLATPRLLVSILENNQLEDGTILIPKALHKYLGGKERLIPGEK